jgi:hypothetical protein
MQAINQNRSSLSIKDKGGFSDQKQAISRFDNHYNRELSALSAYADQERLRGSMRNPKILKTEGSYLSNIKEPNISNKESMSNQ